QADPFTVSSAEDLNRIRNYLGSASSRTYFKLIADIDMDTFLSPGGEGYAMWGTQGWNPIGNSTSTMFYGGLDGDGHTISNLRTSFYETYHGLFGMTAAGSMIKNLHLSSSCSILGNGDTGSIVGHNKGTIENCSSAATVNIGNATIGGGICGNHNAGSIINCSFSGTVSRSAAGVNANSLGGIAGRNETSAVITNCSSSGTITGSTWNGGLVGWNNGTINLSYSTGIVSCNNNTIGGLVGQNQGSINNSYSRVNVTGAHYIGGLVGYHGSGSILNCYSTGTVSGGQKGGLIGASGGTVTSSYWDTQTSGIATSFGGTGKTTAQMQTQSTYTGWDFGVETENGTNDYWFMTTEDNGAYPFLIWEKAGELRAPILLSPADQATAMPVGGFNLSWSPNPIGLVPNWYNVYLRRYNALGVMEERLVTGLMNTTSFNPCNLPGFAPAYEATWYWTVEAVRQGTVVRRLPLCSFQFEQDPVIDTFPSSEDFANPAFPPYSWSNTGWERHSVNAFGAAGDGSARAYFYLLDIGVTVDLITKRIDNHGLGGNLSFDFAYTPDGTRIDLLEILASTDDGASYSSLATYTGGVDGSLNTTPGQTIETDFVPSASQWATRSLAFPAGTDYIKFRGTSAHGNNLFIDNITFDSLPLLSPSNVQISADFWGQGTITWEAVPGATWYGFYMGTDPNNLSYIGYTTRLIMLGDFFNYDKLFFRISAGNGSPVGNDLTWWGF
ncbi:MAG TPA: GLUG motif-containing protein, partial [Candidatus Cloacimonadota bacterium]|nr:GLUG motif-containing protein [Candidatus Cloacimonadota bacterium]